MSSTGIKLIYTIFNTWKSLKQGYETPTENGLTEWYCQAVQEDAWSYKSSIAVVKQCHKMATARAKWSNGRGNNFTTTRNYSIYMST
jgi:hypothetical protein